MAFNFRKSVTFQLGQASKAYRARAGSHLTKLSLHPGQEAVLKILDENAGLTMGQLAAELSVQPPTVAKMIKRLSLQGLVRREVDEHDGRSVQVFLTDAGQEILSLLDQSWKRLEREALAGLDEKDRKKLRKLLRSVEKNLAKLQNKNDVDDEPD